MWVVERATTQTVQVLRHQFVIAFLGGLSESNNCATAIANGFPKKSYYSFLIAKKGELNVESEDRYLLLTLKKLRHTDL